METVAWLGFSQGLFAAIIMLAKSNRSVPDKLLTAWLSLLAIEFFSCAMDYTLFGYPLLSSSFLLFNPAFYVYVKSLVKRDYTLKWVQLLHLAPFVFFEVFAYILHVPHDMDSFLKFDSTLWFRSFFSFASFASWILYNYATAVIIYRHRKQLVNEYSTLESNKSVGWLIFVVVFYNAFTFASVVIALVSIVIDIEFPISPVYNYSALLLMVYVLGFYGLKQQVIFRSARVDTSIPERYVNSLLSDSRKREIKEQLLEHFQKKKPYLNPDLSMDMLSDELSIPKYQITEVLNMDIGKNFFQFANEYRVEAVKKHLCNPKSKYSIEAIGYECGFSSKSSFFTVFKKLTGLTPLQYKNSLTDS